MSLRSWFRGSSAQAPASPTTSTPGTSTPPPPSNVSNPSASTISLAINDPLAQKIADIEEAMDAMGLTLNDDVEGAEARLRACKDPSSFHMLGLGVAIFMRSILGFEKDVMAEASSRITETENRAWADMKKEQAAAGGGGGWFSRRGEISVNESNLSVYPPGTEFALVHATAQLMSAVVGVLHETVADGVKGFLKLRKAYLTLDSIMQAEEAAERKWRQKNNVGSATSKPSLVNLPETETGENEKKDSSKVSSAEDEMVFEDAAQDLSGTRTPASYQGHLSKPGADSASGTGTPILPADTPLPSATLGNNSNEAPFINTPIDIFIYSGVSMSYGMLLLMISLVPPALSRLLSIVGFRGDRDKGMRLLWSSASYPNVMGAVAGLILLGLYNGFYSFADIIASDTDIATLADPSENVGYPKDRCSTLLKQLRARYPDSGLWKLEHARILANTGRLSEAVEALKGNGESKMRQVAALNCFELSINSMFMLDWPFVRDSFLRCVELNNWSHALYYYMAGCAELEIYRDAFARAAALRGDESKTAEAEEAAHAVEKHRNRAQELLRKTPVLAGQKKFMSRPMPFEQFVVRKMARWEARAKELDIELVDAIGSSPAIELIMLWNGSVRMSTELLGQARKYVGWERATAPAEKLSKLKTVDEVAIADLSDAFLLRGMKEYGPAKEALDKLATLDRFAFKGTNLDDYVPALVHYELAVLHWNQGCDPSLYPEDKDAVDEWRRSKINEAHECLERVAKWETFTLDARLGMRVQIGIDTIKWLKGKKNWV